MLTTIALAAVLSGIPAQPGALKISNVRLLTSEFGPPCASSKFLPGDVFFIAYDVDGITISGDGNVHYTMSMEVTNPNGKPYLKQDPRDSFELAPLRGNKLPMRGYITVGLDQPAGIYNCKFTVTDPKTKASDTINVKFEVVKKDLGIVAVHPTYDPEGKINAPNNGQVGQTICIFFAVASFERDAKTKQPNVKVQFQFLDEQGKPLLTDDKNQPTPREHIQDAQSPFPVKDTDGAFTIMFPLFMNRPGKFTVEITAEDRVSKKKVSYKLPVTVVNQIK